MSENKKQLDTPNATRETVSSNDHNSASPAALNLTANLISSFPEFLNLLPDPGVITNHIAKIPVMKAKWLWFYRFLTQISCLITCITVSNAHINFSASNAVNSSIITLLTWIVILSIFLKDDNRLNKIEIYTQVLMFWLSVSFIIFPFTLICFQPSFAILVSAVTIFCLLTYRFIILPLLKHSFRNMISYFPSYLFLLTSIYIIFDFSIINPFTSSS